MPSLKSTSRSPGSMVTWLRRVRRLLEHAEREAAAVGLADALEAAVRAAEQRRQMAGVDEFEPAVARIVEAEEERDEARRAGCGA